MVRPTSPSVGSIFFLPRSSLMVLRWSDTTTARNYGEKRVIALGIADGILLTVVYTDRVEGGGDVVRRIISARVSNRRERKAYRQTFSPER